MAKQYRTLHPTKYYRDHLAHDIRPDGRELDKYRPVIINSGSISTADGSAIAKVGKTTVICGIKAEFCLPKADVVDKGFIIPNIELGPLCSPKFKSGPPSDQAQAATKILADVIENSGCVNLEDLCIFKEKLVWCLFVDLVCLDHDGSIIDACLLALFAALKTVRLPEVDFDPQTEEKSVNMENMLPLTLRSTPVSTTFAIFDDNVFLIDPTSEEESLCTGVITVVTKGKELCSVLKPGGSPISEEKLLDCIKKAVDRAGLLNEVIEAATKEFNVNK